MAFLVGVRIVTDTPTLTRQVWVSSAAKRMQSGWRKSAELTHGASFLPLEGEGE